MRTRPDIMTHKSVSRCNLRIRVLFRHAVVIRRTAHILLPKTVQDVLKSVRSADKFCVDIMCILLLLGMIAVLYGVIQNT